MNKRRTGSLAAENHTLLKSSIHLTWDIKIENKPKTFEEIGETR